MLTKDTYKGVFVILLTPFNDDLTLDERSYETMLDFCLEAGVQGVVANANASEGAYLTEAERRRLAELTIKHAKGKAQTVVTVSAPGPATSLPLAKHAEEIGADAVMAMPPTFQKPTEAQIKAFYEELSRTTNLPLILQNFSGPGGTPMAPRLVAELARTLPNAHYVKEETDFPAVATSETLALGGDAIFGVMGGKGGKAMLDEYRRGSCGTMPACQLADVYTKLWPLLDAGQTEDARALFALLLQEVAFSIGYGAKLYKEVAYRRGIIKNPICRQTGYSTLDRYSHAELTAILNDLRPHLMAQHLPSS